MKLSVVISMYNASRYPIEVIDNLLLPSLMRNASLDKELIILDDCSPLKHKTSALISDYKSYLEKIFGNVVFERNEKNLGFSGSYNKGINIAEGDIIVVGNSDIYVPEGNIDSLVSTLLANPRYGLVAPITNQPTSKSYQYSKQAPKINNCSKEELSKIEIFSRKINELMKGKTIITDEYGVFGFCFAIRKDIINSVSGFDESFKYGFWEDIDLARRIKQKGYKLVIDPSTYVHHGGIKGAGGSAWQNPARALYALFITNPIKCSIKGRDPLGVLKHMTLDELRQTGFNTVSEDIEKELRKQGKTSVF